MSEFSESIRDQVELGQAWVVENYRSRLLAFVRAEREKAETTLDGYISACDTFIAWLEKEDGNDTP